MKIAEIFQSIHGEVNGHHQGRICTFIRFSGCNLHCHYCDTSHTQYSNYGKEMSILEIVQTTVNLGSRYVCFTGGEPLINIKEISQLANELTELGFNISIETNGTIDVSPLIDGLYHTNLMIDSFIIDFKIGIPNYNPVMSNFFKLGNDDVIKFVVGNLKELDKAIEKHDEIRGGYPTFHSQPIFAFSSYDLKSLSPNMIFDHLIKNKIVNALISLQIHKILGFQ